MSETNYGEVNASAKIVNVAGVINNHPPAAPSEPQVQPRRWEPHRAMIIAAVITAVGTVTAGTVTAIVTGHLGLGSSTPEFHVTGNCDAAGQVLQNDSQGFTPGTPYTSEVLDPSGKPYGGLKSSGVADAAGRVNWRWLCESGDPIGVYRARIRDDRTGRYTTWTTFRVNVS